MSATVYKHITTKINAAISGKCYAFAKPTKHKAKEPYVVFTLRGEPNITKDSPVQDLVLCEVKYYDINKDDAITNAEAIRTALQYYTGTSDGTTIKKIHCVEWLVPEQFEDTAGNIIYETIYTYQIRLTL